MNQLSGNKVRVNDVAQSFFELSDDESHKKDLLSKCKIQKLIYYAQGFYLALHGVPLFEDELVAWDIGPVSRTLFFTNHFNKNRQHICGLSADSSRLSREQKDFIIEIYAQYGTYSGEELLAMSCSEPPWRNSFEDEAMEKAISFDDLKQYFITRIDS